MKTITLTIVLALVATLSFAQFPQSTSPDSCCYETADLRAAIYQGNPDFIHVKVAKMSGDKIKFRVKDGAKTLYSKNYKKYARVDVQYDIKDLPVGAYTFEILKGSEVVYSRVIDKSQDQEMLVSNR
jgi:hypothetical protein